MKYITKEMIYRRALKLMSADFTYAVLEPDDTKYLFENWSRREKRSATSMKSYLVRAKGELQEEMFRKALGVENVSRRD